jgi:hypothetical protein
VTSVNRLYSCCSSMEFFSPVCCSFSYSDAIDLEVSLGCAVMFGSDCRFPLEILLLLLCSLIDLCLLWFPYQIRIWLEASGQVVRPSSDLFTVPTFVLRLDFCSSFLDFGLCDGSSFTHDFPHAHVHSARANFLSSVLATVACLGFHFSFLRIVLLFVRSCVLSNAQPWSVSPSESGLSSRPWLGTGSCSRLW